MSQLNSFSHRPHENRGDLTTGANTKLDPQTFIAAGYTVLNNFITAAECERYISRIVEFRTGHKVTEINRASRERSLRYSVINGLQIAEHLPEIHKLYLELLPDISRMTGLPLAPLENKQVGVNINITRPGGEYRWHYDRNRITAILYLNSVDGGETECYPNYRLLLNRFRYSVLQHRLDQLLLQKTARRLFGRRVLLKPRPGSLLLMRADRCLHSVRPVRGSTDRINIIMAYDLPDADFEVEKMLDSYLYENEFSSTSDPNYK